MEDFERELKEDFLEESIQLLGDSEQAFLTLEDDKGNVELLDQIFRLAHNLKGTSRAVGFGGVAEFTHEMENLILKLKTGELEVTDSTVTVLLACNDHITHMIRTLRENLDATFDSSEIIAQIGRAINGELEDTQNDSSASSDKDDVEDKIEDEEYQEEESELIEVRGKWEGEDSSEEIPVSANETVENGPDTQSDSNISSAALESLREMGILDFENANPLNIKAPEAKNSEEGMTFKKGESDITVKEPTVEKKSPSTAAPTSAGPKTQSTKAEDESIRVSLSRVEKLNNVVGELVILQTVLDQRRHSVINDSLANKSISQLGKLSKEIQEISMSLRMVPVKATLQKMNRIIRDTSKALDKKVRLVLIGEETEIDKTVLEHLSDPLVHIVRNACDHGLESTEGRIKAGKSETGNITIAAFHEGNNLVIEIKDDGNGIDPDVIRKKAIERKLIGANSQISDLDIIQYIFHPGFSTKEQVTEVSGRGVGMDVVKTNIEKLSGAVQVKTSLGGGSTFKVVLPLTMAIIDGMVIRVGTDKYIIPLAQVHESLKPTKEIVHFVTGLGNCLNLRGEVLPLFNIGKTLNRKMDTSSDWDKIAIIIQSSEFNFAVLVDDILHQQQVVIKTLGGEIKNNKGFMGSSILGDGKPSFILDLNELYSSSLKKNQNNIGNSNIGKVA